MAIVISHGKFDRERLAAEIKTLDALVRDLERLLNGEHPNPKELADAPLINNWRFDRREATCLVSTFLKLPRLGPIVPNDITSELWYINVNVGCARTFSRFYSRVKPARFRDSNC